MPYQHSFPTEKEYVSHSSYQVPGDRGYVRDRKASSEPASVRVQSVPHRTSWNMQPEIEEQLPTWSSVKEQQEQMLVQRQKKNQQTHRVRPPEEAQPQQQSQSQPQSKQPSNLRPPTSSRVRTAADQRPSTSRKGTAQKQLSKSDMEGILTQLNMEKMQLETEISKQHQHSRSREQLQRRVAIETRLDTVMKEINGLKSALRASSKPKP